MATSSGVRLMIDFKSKADLIEFARDLKAHGFIPEHGGVFRADGLDIKNDAGGISVGSSYVVKGIKDRGEHGRVV